MVHNRICQTRPEAPCQPAKPQPQPNSRVSPVSLHRIVHVKQDLVPHIIHTSPRIQRSLMMSVPHHSHYPDAPATFRTNRSAITPATHSPPSRVTMPMSSFFLDFVTPDPPSAFPLGRYRSTWQSTTRWHLGPGTGEFWSERRFEPCLSFTKR